MSAPTFLFPGQGSQVIGMAKSFYETSSQVREFFQEAGDIASLDLVGLCFKGPMEVLTETRNLQPAMTTAVLACLLAIEEYDVIPEFVAGHSLGEYAALAAARVISFQDCIRLVTVRGRLMQEQAEAHPGAMLAVVKMDAALLEARVNALAAKQIIRISNYNTPQQLVVSGTVEAIAQLEEGLKRERFRCTRLQVSGAWHCKLMAEAEAPFNELLDQIPFSNAKMPVLLNVTGAPETDGARIKARMKEQMCSGVRWYQGIQAAWTAGGRTFVEVGPKGVLSKMMSQIVPDAATFRTTFIDSTASLEAFFEDDEV